MRTTKTNLRNQDLEDNAPLKVMLRNKEISVRMMNNAVARRFDVYTAKCEISYDEDKKQLFVKMNGNRDLAPKCVSLIILRSWFKVTFFHWIYWRYLDKHYSQVELSIPLKAGLSLGESNALLTNLLCLQDNSQMIQKATQGIIRNTIAAPASAQE